MNKRDTIIYWTGFCVIVALLIAAPLVLPEYRVKISTTKETITACAGLIQIEA